MRVSVFSYLSDLLTLSDELVRKALFSLPESYRTVIILRHYQRLRFREIAEVLEMPMGTVKPTGKEMT